jgi:hypothetical protein
MAVVECRPLAAILRHRKGAGVECGVWVESDDDQVTDGDKGV